MKISRAPRADSKRWSQSEMEWEEFLEYLETPAAHKQCGNYLFGSLMGNVRRGDTVVSRTAITLDADSAAPELPDRVEALGVTAAMHTTWRSTPTDLRYRIIIPLATPVGPTEYRAATRSLMHELGIEQFDPGSEQPERYMFFPSAQDPAYYESFTFSGPLLEAADWLGDEPLDLAQDPIPATRKADPYEAPGAIGAFNRAYDIQKAIDEFDLPYVPEEDPGRWRHKDASSRNGLAEIQPGIVFSHHSKHDPAYGEGALNAFDLVRVHRFGDMDLLAPQDTPTNRLPSHLAMLDFAMTLPDVVTDVATTSGLADGIDEATWRTQLALKPSNLAMVDTISNWDLLVKHWFPALRYNELTLQVETADDTLPWRDDARERPTFSEADRAALCLQVEREFKLRPSRSYVNELVDVTAARNRYNPLVTYLESLEWDGVPRLETCLPGAEDTPYNRLVARKCLVAAVARVMEPGIKWDHTLILYGNEGLGKSWWIDTMARGYSAVLKDIRDKDTLLMLQRNWIMVADEGYSLRKADSDALKQFLTQREDQFRAPFAREVEVHPRHCVVWGTTNDDVFLRRQEGNRRFLIVHCKHPVDFDSLTPKEVDQIWAEAMHLYLAGEKLYLTPAEAELANDIRENYTEEDALAGVISAYLELPVPANWDDMSAEARITYRADVADGIVAPGTERIKSVCTAQIWHEVMGRAPGTHKRTDLLAIGESLRRLGWVSSGVKSWTSQYGSQRLYTRPLT